MMGVAALSMGRRPLMIWGCTTGGNRYGQTSWCLGTRPFSHGRFGAPIAHGRDDPGT